MWLSLRRPCFSGTLLMLLILKLPLWENVVSVPMYARLADHGEMSLKNLLERAITLSQNIRELTAEMQRIFLDDVKYKPGQWFPERDLTGCHTSTFALLIPKEGAPQITGVFLLKEMIGMLGSWRTPLHYIANELSHMEEAPNDIISRAKTIEAKINELTEALKRIVSKIHPGFSESYVYPYWNGLASLQSPDEDTRFFALYNLFQCLTKDSRKVDSNLRLLMCQLVYKIDC